MRENCERCGEPHASYRRIRMENELEHLMYYVTLLLCDKCAWELRDKITETIREFAGKMQLEPLVPMRESVEEQDDDWILDDLETP
jgi:RNase P subunit RPR2